MTDKERIEELERRVRELESRPVMPAIIVLPLPLPSMPAPPFYPSWPGVEINPVPTIPPIQPYSPLVQPIWYVDYSSLPTCQG